MGIQDGVDQLDKRHTRKKVRPMRRENDTLCSVGEILELEVSGPAKWPIVHLADCPKVRDFSISTLHCRIGKQRRAHER